MKFMETMKSKSEALELIYQDTEIHFLFSDDENVMVNATEMAKAFGKRPIDFLRLDSTKNLIETICKDENFRMIFGVGSEEISLPNRKNKIFETKSTGKNNGTWMHKILALEFASWLDSEFKLWILVTIDNILFGKAKTVANKITDAEKKKLEIATLIENVKKINNPEMNKLLIELDELKKIESDKKKAMRQFSNQYKMF